MPANSDYEQLLVPLLGQAGAYARSILRNRHDAEDAVQQAALRGLQRIGTYDAARPFKAWWFTILRNCCIDVLRDAEAARTDSLDDHDVPAPPPPDLADWERLSIALGQLSADHREILRLRYFADMSYRELAATLSIPAGTVMSRLHLARNALAAKTREDES